MCAGIDDVGSSGVPLGFPKLFVRLLVQQAVLDWICNMQMIFRDIFLVDVTQSAYPSQILYAG